MIRQNLFDGFASINEIRRQSARVDAAAHRVHDAARGLWIDGWRSNADLYFGKREPIACTVALG